VSDQDDPEIILKEGEVICDKCNGDGYDSDISPTSFFKLKCEKCQGKKKVDWISNITGIKQEPLTIAGSTSSLRSSYLTNSKIHLDGDVMVGDKPLNEYVRDIAAKELSDKIDGEILRSLEKTWQQNNKKDKGWRKIFDNRIFSKLLFFNNSK
jgi:hypothetical protein